MELIVLTKSQTIDFFTFISLSNHPPNVIKQVPNSIQRRLSKKLSNEEIFNTAKREYENALQVGSKLILNTPKINDKNQKIALELLFGLTHHSPKQYPQMLQTFSD